MCEYVVGFVLGIAASFIVWIIPIKIIVPKLNFSEKITRTIRPYQEIARYRFYLINNGLRDVFDTSIFFQVKIKGLMEDTPEVYEIVNIPVGASDGHVSLIGAKEKKRLSINTHKCDRFREPYFPDWVREKFSYASLSLDDVFSLGTYVEAQFIAYGYDKWSGTRKFFESKIYTHSNIIDETDDIRELVKEIEVQPFSKPSYRGGGGEEEEV